MAGVLILRDPLLVAIQIRCLGAERKLPNLRATVQKVGDLSRDYSIGRSFLYK